MNPGGCADVVVTSMFAMGSQNVEVVVFCVPATVAVAVSSDWIQSA
jgi:hypothetical protein